MTYEKGFELFILERKKAERTYRSHLQIQKGGRKKRNNPSFLFSADTVTSNRVSLKEGGGKGDIRQKYLKLRMVEHRNRLSE